MRIQKNIRSNLKGSVFALLKEKGIQNNATIKGKTSDGGEYNITTFAGKEGDANFEEMCKAFKVTEADLQKVKETK